jgi:hypothetical protein
VLLIIPASKTNWIPSARATWNLSVLIIGIFITPGRRGISIFLAVLFKV